MSKLIPLPCLADPSLAQLRVLVLEDNEFERKLLVAMLRRLGVVHVSQAGNGSEALDLVDRATDGFDLILCDLQMRGCEGMDGIEFLRKAAPERIGSLVLLSGLDEDLLMAAETLASAGGAAWGGCLRKPPAESRLLEVLAACKSRAADAPRALPARLQRPRWTKADIRMGIRRNEFVPFFQPKQRLADGCFIGVEALARWQHRSAGLVLPGEFVPLMEREGMIDELTDIILDRSLDTIAAFARHGRTLPVAINVSPLTLENVDLPDRWRAAVEGRGIDPSLLTVEVTETAVAQDFFGLLESITRLRMHGFRVSLDDFGTGYSSLQQMSELPANELKIDRSFVDRALRSTRGAMIFDSIASLAKKLGMTVVAEGIETTAHATFVQAMGCDAGQGWHLGRPMSGDALLAHLSTLS